MKLHLADSRSPAFTCGGCDSLFKLVLCLLFLCIHSGCGVLRKKEAPSDADLIVAREGKISPEKSQEVMGSVAENWFYGQGLGKSALNIGTIVLFPPYAAYILGNAVLDVAGYEPLYVTNLLPDEQKQGYDRVYESVTSFPGRVTAAVAGKEFRSAEVGRLRLKGVLGSEDKAADSEG